ncbi:hypothetical protein M422DRAFT_221900 [Sphaerobolus stellatus SS14]|nr:hypothetical protein M422DRAFT_221900 [Sphaerobolus stellatus SS14]
MPAARPYVEPAIATILVLGGFLVLLNIINVILDILLYCGLIGQILIGLLFGTPGIKVLGDYLEEVVTDLGYIGLILSVYEGGLSTSVDGLVRSALVSFLVAATGILLPIALSFFLILFSNATPLQSFAAGASLSATSLGTTFTVISKCGLLNTDVGTVLTSAAMLDDIVGLIMLQVVTQLNNGIGEKTNYGAIIGRPLGVSLGFVILVAILCRWILLPFHSWIMYFVSNAKGHSFYRLWDSEGFSFIVHSATLIGAVVAGEYAGTSRLFTAFIAGLLVRWWSDRTMEKTQLNNDSTHSSTSLPGAQIYERYYGPPTKTILRPFFFASIGFSIPITRMFRASTVWRGFLYALLMFLGKAATGFWLWLIPRPMDIKLFTKSSKSHENKTLKSQATEAQGKEKGTIKQSNIMNTSVEESTILESDPSLSQTGLRTPPSEEVNPMTSAKDESPSRTTGSRASELVPTQNSLRAYGPLLLGTAMTARGEIGFLIASIGATHGIFRDTSAVPQDPVEAQAIENDELYLVVIWAIVLCTIIGPIGVGALVRRLRRMDIQTRS